MREYERVDHRGRRVPQPSPRGTSWRSGQRPTTRACPRLVMRSSGGVATLDEAAAHPA